MVERSMCYVIYRNLAGKSALFIYIRGLFQVAGENPENRITPRKLVATLFRLSLQAT